MFSMIWACYNDIVQVSDYHFLFWTLFHFISTFFTLRASRSHRIYCVAAHSRWTTTASRANALYLRQPRPVNNPGLLYRMRLILQPSRFMFMTVAFPNPGWQKIQLAVLSDQVVWWRNRITNLISHSASSDGFRNASVHNQNRDWRLTFAYSLNFEWHWGK